MIRQHEIIKIVADLQSRGELELAQRVAGQYMDRLDSGELRFNHLALTAKLGRDDQVMDLLENYLATRRWFSTWFLQRIPELKSLEPLPRYRKIVQTTEDQEAQYWLVKTMEPVTQVPALAQPTYPLLIAIHGNGFNSRHSAIQWEFAAGAGWLVFHPLAKRLVGYGSHWWDSHEENCALIVEQSNELFRQYPIDSSRVIFAGFSKGGEVAMVLALQNWLQAKGFITVGAGGYYHMQPEHWDPLLKSVPPGLRGVAMFSPYDLERAEDGGQTLKKLQAAGIDIQVEKYPAEGHVFPGDFPIRFDRAVDFIFQRK